RAEGEAEGCGREVGRLATVRTARFRIVAATRGGQGEGGGETRGGGSRPAGSQSGPTVDGERETIESAAHREQFHPDQPGSTRRDRRARFLPGRPGRGRGICFGPMMPARR